MKVIGINASPSRDRFQADGRPEFINQVFRVVLEVVRSSIYE